MDSNSKVFVAGHKGLVGSAILRNLQSKGYKNLVTANKDDYDLRHTSTVNNLFSHAKPDYVFLAAAKVGGILANRDHPADFIYDNLMIQTNVIDAAYRNGVKKLLFLESLNWELSRILYLFLNKKFDTEEMIPGLSLQLIFKI